MSIGNTRRQMARTVQLMSIFALFSTFACQPSLADARFDKHLTLGKTYLVKQDFEMALKQFNLALKLTPGSPKVLIERGTAYSELGKYDLAIADFTQAITLDKSSYLGYNNRGVAYWRKGDLTKAILDLDQAIKTDGRQAVAYLNRAGASLSALNSKECALSAEKLNTWLSSNWKDPFATHATVLAVLSYRQGGKPKEATRLNTLAMGKVDQLKWPYPLLQKFAGKITLEKLMEEAEKSDYDFTQAQTFLGLDHLLKGDKKQANDKLIWASKHGERNCVEYWIARGASNLIDK